MDFCWLMKPFVAKLLLESYSLFPPDPPLFCTTHSLLSFGVDTRVRIVSLRGFQCLLCSFLGSSVLSFSSAILLSVVVIVSIVVIAFLLKVAVQVSPCWPKLIRQLDTWSSCFTVAFSEYSLPIKFLFFAKVEILFVQKVSFSFTG